MSRPQIIQCHLGRHTVKMEMFFLWKSVLFQHYTLSMHALWQHGSVALEDTTGQILCFWVKHVIFWASMDIGITFYILAITWTYEYGGLWACIGMITWTLGTGKCKCIVYVLVHCCILLHSLFTWEEALGIQYRVIHVVLHWCFMFLLLI